MKFLFDNTFENQARFGDEKMKRNGKKQKTKNDAKSQKKARKYPKVELL